MKQDLCQTQWAKWIEISGFVAKPQHILGCRNGSFRGFIEQSLP